MIVSQSLQCSGCRVEGVGYRQIYLRSNITQLFSTLLQEVQSWRRVDSVTRIISQVLVSLHLLRPCQQVAIRIRTSGLVQVRCLTNTTRKP